MLIQNMPEIAGTYSGGVMIIGGGRSMWDDYEKAMALCPKWHTIIVNCAGFVIDRPVEHLFSWHWAQISAIKKFRLAEWPDCKAIVHSNKKNGKVDCVWDFSGERSVSGLAAIDLAFLLGYNKVILVGIPQDNSGYFYKSPKMINTDLFDRDRLREVTKLASEYSGKIRSFSGHTKEVYGYPNQEWVNGNI
jgi:hypothetical protein